MAAHATSATPDLRAPTVARAERRVSAGLAVFAAYHLALAAWMAISPHSFYVHVGPFGVANDHYVRDVATYNAAIGVALALAVRRPAWRVPLLTLATLQFALHSINHLADIGRAHPAWNGPADFASLTVATAVLAWLLREAVRIRPSSPPPRRQGASP